MQRQRRVALGRHIGFEPRRLGDAQSLDAGKAVVGKGELIDDRDAQPGATSPQTVVPKRALMRMS